MANEEHLEILRQEVEVWNQWREEQREVHGNLPGPDLSGADLRSENKLDIRIEGGRLVCLGRLP
jgi:hypothetical protein